ncbi:MAG: hypothetical protein ACLGHQ_14765, partial [Acidimicrobiia bacterium]
TTLDEVGFDQPRPGRRRLLVGLAGAAAAGVAASAFDPSGVARAADGDPINIGEDNDGTLLTQLRRPTGDADIDVFQANDASEPATTSPHPAALAGTATGNTVYNGVHGLTSARVDGEVTTGFGLIGHATDDARAPLWLVPKTDPTADTIEHQVGEVVVDADGHFWACVAAGTPGTWVDLAAPLVDTTQLQPQYFPIDPIRCYDSREEAYAESGPIARLERRVVSVADSHDRSGVVIATDVVPEGATAITYNITVARPTAVNWLAVAPGDQTDAPQFSSINFSVGRNDANGLTGKLDDDRQVAVFCGDDVGSCHFIIDVTGYYALPTPTPVVPPV